jgi:5-deoxy-D-glucuronate isomerase
MNRNVVRHPGAFPPGYTELIGPVSPTLRTGITFGILKLRPEGTHAYNTNRETALLLLQGRIEVRVGDRPAALARSSLLDEPPVAVHACRGTPVTLHARSECELALLQVENDRAFAPMVFDRQTMIPTERRGCGTLDDTACRLVRTVFDSRNRPEANLVLGEVVTPQGRWSSYPPHHHPQPEIYHYRFVPEGGFGFGELGQDVVRLHHRDTLVIPPGADHAQVAAPGYTLYYLWAIRNLPGAIYRGPVFTQAHRWLLDGTVEVWRPKEGAS